MVPLSLLYTSNFTVLSDIWLPSISKFKFTARYGGYDYGTIFFSLFEQGAKMKDCETACTDKKYDLQVHDSQFR